MIACTFGVYPLCVLQNVLHTFYQANIDYLRNWQTFILTSGITMVFFCIVWLICNYLWIDIYGFFPPIPFGGYAIAIISVPGIYATMWFRIPESVRTEKELKKRFGIFLVSRLYDMLHSRQICLV